MRCNFYLHFSDVRPTTALLAETLSRSPPATSRAAADLFLFLVRRSFHPPDGALALVVRISPAAAISPPPAPSSRSFRPHSDPPHSRPTSSTSGELGAPLTHSRCSTNCLSNFVVDNDTWFVEAQTRAAFYPKFENDKSDQELVFFLPVMVLMQYELVLLCPSLVAASAAWCTLKSSSIYTKETLKYHTGFSELQLLYCQDDLRPFHMYFEDDGGLNPVAMLHRKWYWCGALTAWVHHQ